MVAQAMWWGKSRIKLNSASYSCGLAELCNLIFYFPRMVVQAMWWVGCAGYVVGKIKNKAKLSQLELDTLQDTL